jgi:hypothetical protein
MKHNVHSWTVQRVAEWLEADMAMPQYATRFLEAAVDGPMLLKLSGEDYQDLLGVSEPVHRAKLVDAVQALADMDMREYGVELGRVGEYLALLDRDRVAALAHLKEAFDTLDADKVGTRACMHDCVRCWS